MWTDESFWDTKRLPITLSYKHPPPPSLGHNSLIAGVGARLQIRVSLTRGERREDLLFPQGTCEPRALSRHLRAIIHSRLLYKLEMGEGMSGGLTFQLRVPLNPGFRQEKIRGQRGTLPVQALGYVKFGKVIFRRPFATEV